MSDKKYPKFVVGSSILNEKGELFLRTTPNQDNKFTCINAKVEWGNTIEETIKKSVKDKTGLEAISYELIRLTDGLNITAIDNPEPINMIFADFKVHVINSYKLEQEDKTRMYKWLTPNGWLKLDKDTFGPYIYEIVNKLAE